MVKKKVQFSPHIFAEWGELFKNLTTEQRSDILLGITMYPNYNPENNPVWGFIKSQIDKEFELFNERCEKNSQISKSYWDKAKDIERNRTDTERIPNGTERYPKQEHKQKLEQKQEIKTEIKSNDLFGNQNNQNNQKTINGIQLDTKCISKDIQVISNTKDKDKNKVKDKEKQSLLLDELINKYPNLKEPMDRWLKYKKEKKEKYTDTGLEDCIEKLNRLSGGDKNLAMDIVKQSTSNNWSGLFPLKDNYKKQPQMIIPQDMSIYDVDKDPFEV